MATTETEVANIAGVHIGAPKIMDIDDRDNKTARVFKGLFDSTVAAVGAMHKWNCLKKRAFGARQLDKPLFAAEGGWAEQFRLPADFLTMVSINGLDAERHSDKWEIEGDFVLMNAEEARLRYIAHIRNVVTWKPGFVDAVAFYLASRACTPIRQDKAKSLELKQEFWERVLPDAKKTDSNEVNQRTIDSTFGSAYDRARNVSTLG